VTEDHIQILIYTHAALGGLSLLSGGIALIAKKGRTVHKRSGEIFFYSMLISALLALLISVLPNHISPFLFCVGIFSTYLILSGYRSILLKRKGMDLRADKILSAIMIITGLAMIFYPIIIEGAVNIVLLVFGALGILFGLRDFQLFLKPESLRKKWLNRHLGNMTGGYIAAITAFFVVNDIIGGLFNWFLPTVFGSIYISYWIRKLSVKKTNPKMQ